MYDIIELNGKLVPELKEIAKKLNIPKYDKLVKQDLIYKILDHQALNPAATAKKEEKPKRKIILRRKSKRVTTEDAEKVELKEQVEEKDISHYRKNFFDCLIIWEHELKNPNQVVAKTNNFMDK